MISKFFIDRPRFAFVISIVITLAGIVALFTLPVTQYPDITPGQVSISATYPGADAKTVQETVIQPIEAQVNGVKRMIYMSSNATDTGAATITVTFDIGTDGDSNTVNTQNRVNWASAQLPEEVRRQSVIVKEKSPSMLLVIALFSPDGRYDDLFLSNYASIYLKDELARIPGVGEVQLLGEHKYSMRIWLDPERMAGMNMTVDEVTNALKQQNVQVSAGALGEAPTGGNGIFRYALQTQGRLSEVSEFEEIVVRSTPDGAQVKLKNIAEVELGAENYSSTGTYNGKPAALLAVYQLNEANGIQIREACAARLEELKAYFPEGIDYGIPFDTTSFITASIDEVAMTLIIAVILVVAITYLFLQDWRSTVVPTLAIPVSLIGTFAVLLVIGYTINLITLFALILAIGIVVDDAIVVIENVNRLMEEEHLSPKQAAVKSMEEVTGPVIATTAVLLAMFIPICFLPGITGEMYRQFGITIAVSVVISSVNALTLSPALCSILLKPVEPGGKKFFLFRWFNGGFERLTGGYIRLVRLIVRRALFALVLFAVIVFGCYWFYVNLPTGFIPEEDQGKLFVNIQLPDAASFDRTQAFTERVVEEVRKVDGVVDVLGVAGYSILTGSQASNNSMVLVSLLPWKERKSPELSQDAIQRKLQALLNRDPGAVVQVFGLPTIQGIGTTGGFSFVVEDTTGTYPERLETAVNDLCAAARQNPAIGSAYSTFRAQVPQVFLNIDREKALKLGVAISDINTALQGLTGYTYVNDFNKFGKVYKVEIQAAARARRTVPDVRGIYVPNSQGEMVPLGTLVEVEQRLSPQYLNRYNMYSSATINGSNAPGYSTGQAMEAMEELARQILPEGMKFDWTDMSYQEKAANQPVRLGGGVSLNMTMIIFSLALLFMYLFLVAQYESWMIPVAVLLSVPIAFFGSLLFLWVMNVENNIYTQVGFVLLFGLACKTAILIVEFAKVSHEQGKSIFDAAVEAAKLRFRAVLMTAISFILGVLPLVVATGAGAASRVSLGSAVFGGMIVAAIGGTLLVPMFYAVVQRLIEFRRGKNAPER
ncbi:efflux RND transporter permease subunit [uncultured Victivallis sp.]|uniref:efflux RND transporter permease subunit n=1 Tax=uncultured Victivallis sp. TaxID=354118 RepID=UPI0025D2CC91|nr:multidrug efflux RND transporter permease subunit [uncultured Victivallis sp.]